MKNKNILSDGLASIVIFFINIIAVFFGGAFWFFGWPILVFYSLLLGVRGYKKGISNIEKNMSVIGIILNGLAIICVFVLILLIKY